MPESSARRFAERVVRSVSARGRRLARPFVRAARAFRSEPPRPDPFASRLDPAGPVLVPIPPIVEVPAIGGGRLTLLMPGLEMGRMTGGPNTALNLIARLGEHGVHLRIVATLAALDPEPDLVREHIAHLAGRSLAPDVELGEVSLTEPLEVAPDDIFVATSWQTAHIAEVARLHTTAPAFIYLIQDFEAGFFAFSTNHSLALATYRLPIRAVFNTALLRDHFVTHRIGSFGRSGSEVPWTSFEPAVDQGLFRRATEPPDDGRRRLLFYGRPRNERNLFDIGLRALRLAVDGGGLDPARWEVLSLGAEIPELDLGHGRLLQPAPWMDYPAYAAFVSHSDVMLSLMLSPHTSYPPLEMAAAGGRVVTNVFSVKTADVLQAISPRIDAVEPDPEALAAAILRATAAAETGATEPAGISLPSTWDEAFEATIPWLLETIAELRRGP